MLEISMIDKLKVVFHMTTSNLLFPIILVFFAFISFMFITTNKNNSSKSKKTYALIYLLLITLLLVRYGSNLTTMFDYMMDNVFVVLYFPNIAVYLIAIIITNIIMWISIFSTKTKMIIKLINSIVFSLLHYFLVLILSVINKNSLNVFDQGALYSNNSIHSLIELSSNIFIIWILFLIIYKLVTMYISARSMKKIEDLSVERRGEVKTINRLSNFISELDAPVIVKRDRTFVNVIEEVKEEKPVVENTPIYTDIRIIEETDEETVKETENKLSDLISLYKSIN